MKTPKKKGEHLKKCKKDLTAKKKNDSSARSHKSNIITIKEIFFIHDIK